MFFVVLFSFNLRCKWLDQWAGSVTFLMHIKKLHHCYRFNRWNQKEPTAADPKIDFCLTEVSIGGESNLKTSYIMKSDRRVNTWALGRLIVSAASQSPPEHVGAAPAHDPGRRHGEPRRSGGVLQPLPVHGGGECSGWFIPPQSLWSSPSLWPRGGGGRQVCLKRPGSTLWISQSLAVISIL